MITIEDVYNLTKKTMKNWEVEPTYSSGVVEAMYGYPSNTNFSVEIEVSEEMVELTTYVLIDGIFSYSANMEIYCLEDLENYLGKLNELGEDDLETVRQEMHDALDSHFRDLFQYGL